MPQVLAVPSPQVEWPYRVQYPAPFASRRSRESFREWGDANRILQVPGPASAASANGPNNVTPAGQGELGATGSDAYSIIDGVPCSYTVTAPRCVGWTFPWWVARLDGSTIPSGMRTPEGSVVAVLDTYFRVDWAIGGPADMVGVWIGGSLDASSGANYRNQTPGGASPGLNTGGAGMILRVDGTGYDYLAWGLGGAVTERVPVALTQTQWNCFRYVLVSALPGGAAELQVSVNGALLATRTFGTPELPFLWAATAAVNGRPVTPALVFSGNAVTPPSGVAYAFEGKWGRFLPDGRAVQAE